MVKIVWDETPLKTFSLGKANEEITAAWLTALEELDGEKTHLKFVTTKGSWAPMKGLPPCDADGSVGQSFPDTSLIVADCAVGALIGRVGGGSASLKAVAAATDGGETKPFAIGKFAIIKIPANAFGPVFVGFNVLTRPVVLAADGEIQIFGGKLTT
jgi:hypothetical protein